MIARSHRIVLACITLVPCLAFGQEEATSADSASSNSTAANIVTQALNAAGVADPARPVTDFTATGKITYFWGGDEVSGPATVRGRIGGQFRLDATLPSGTRTMIVSRGLGSIKEPGDEVRPIPTHNAINMDVMTFPYLDLATSVSDPQTVVSNLGSEDFKGIQAVKVRVVRAFSSSQDPDGTLARLCTRDYFLDPDSALLLKTLDMTHPRETLTEDYPHEMEFENYVIFQGVKVPTRIREKVIGQTTWELEITSATFNNGLTDADFAIQ